jgi:hypothetical protein
MSALSVKQVFHNYLATDVYWPQANPLVGSPIPQKLTAML